MRTFVKRILGKCAALNCTAINKFAIKFGALLSALILLTLKANAAGPAVVATVDRTLWPEVINTQAGFDKASRAAQLMYLRNLHSMQTMSDADMLAAFKINSVNRNSVEQWLNEELRLTLNNYRYAAASCSTADWTCIEPPKALPDFLQQAETWLSTVPLAVAAWQTNFNDFAHTYIAEQMRLAALFPKVTSEIATFNANEWTGAKLADREFHLTFDDGPSKAQSTTDVTLAMLNAHKKSGTFFVLGENFQARITATSATAVSTSYGKQCVALHGWEHQSHAKWEQWQDSIVRTQTLVANTIAKPHVSPLFRPPYGQRKSDSADFFSAQHLQVALWNIDSQDWNARVNSSTVENRIISLMLIKRHGVILFHDIHPKAALALPSIFAALGDAVTWGDCHHLARQ